VPARPNSDVGGRHTTTGAYPWSSSRRRLHTTRNSGLPVIQVCPGSTIDLDTAPSAYSVKQACSIVLFNRRSQMNGIRLVRTMLDCRPPTYDGRASTPVASTRSHHRRSAGQSTHLVMDGTNRAEQSRILDTDLGIDVAAGDATLKGTRGPRFAVRHNGAVKSFRDATGGGPILLIHASYRLSAIAIRCTRAFSTARTSRP